MQEQIPLLGNVTTTIDGAPLNLRGRSSTALFSAWLGAGGGTATVAIEARMAGGPWRPKITFGLSGANDAAESILDIENWYEVRARVTAISGGAVVAAVMGV